MPKSKPSSKPGSADVSYAAAVQPGGHSIDDTARFLGHATWIERRLFEVVGGWVRATPEPEARLLFARHSRRHGRHAMELVDLVPATHAHDPDSFVVPDTDGWEPLLDALRHTEATPERLAALGQVVLPQLLATYDRHLGSASTVNEGPVLRCLRGICADDRDDLDDIGVALEALPRTGFGVAPVPRPGAGAPSR